MKYRQYHSNISFLDLLFNALLGFVFMFVIAYMNMNVHAKKADIDRKAEFLISVTWGDGSTDDVDTWLQDPLGNVLFFKQKDIGLAHLDRDDMGINNKVVAANGTTDQNNYRQEITTIRGFIPGEWVLNLHMYAKREKLPAHVHVRIEKVNPVAETIFNKRLTLSRQGEEVTVTRFEMTKQGNILGWSDLPKNLVKVAVNGTHP